MSYKDLKGLMSDLQIQGRSKLTTKSEMIQAITFQDLPIEVMEQIAFRDPDTWSAMTAVPEFGRYSISNQKRAFAKFKSVDKKGTTFLEGEPHSFGDEPAGTMEGAKLWYKRGLKHRDHDRPAIIKLDGTKAWYKNDKLHRDNDQPAVLGSNGYRAWYRNGMRHRDNDQPALIEPHGVMEWYQNGVKVDRNHFANDERD